MNRTQKWMIMLLCLSLVFCLSGGMIYARSTATTTNYYDTGIVDITLREYAVNEAGKEVLYQEDSIPLLLPGTEVSKIPRITNEGNDCWIRVKLDFEGVKGLDGSCLKGMDRDMIYHEDGYYYLHRLLLSGQSVNIFEGIQIPADFDPANEGNTFTLHLQVDAIQARNVAANFDSDTPWGMVAITKQTDEGPHSIRAVTEVQRFSIEYDGNIREVFANSKDFFGNISTLVPGDVYVDSVELVNEGEQPVSIYFRSLSLDQSDLAEKIELSIRVIAGESGKAVEVYHGPLKAEALEKEIKLVTLPAGETGELEFSISVPAGVDNSDSQRAGAVQWTFSTEEMGGKIVLTGDNRSIGVLLLTAGVSLFTGVLIWRVRRKYG